MHTCLARLSERIRNTSLTIRLRQNLLRLTTTAGAIPDSASLASILAGVTRNDAGIAKVAVDTTELTTVNTDDVLHDKVTTGRPAVAVSAGAGDLAVVLDVEVGDVDGTLAVELDDLVARVEGATAVDVGSSSVAPEHLH